MFSSLLPLRSKESVTGGLMVQPLVQSHLQSVVVNATGRCDKVLSGLSETFTRHVLTMTIHPEAPDACLSCLGRNQVAIIFPPLALVRNDFEAMRSEQFGTVGIK